MDKSLGQIFKEMRTSAGLSQRDVANKLGYDTPQFISNWECGVSYPPTSSIKTLAVLYSQIPSVLFNKIYNAKLNDLKEKEQAIFDKSKALKMK